MLEHVRDVKPALKSLERFMTARALIYVEVPDASRYAAFAWSPFQDFNSEHINHFSLTSLDNLMRQCGFRPVRLAAKEILSAPDMPYPAIYCLATRDGTVSPSIVTDTALRQALLDYIEVSARVMRDIDARLSREVGAGQPIIVWGTGELTAKLLADTALGAANIEAFVDSNPINQGGSAPRGAHPRARDAAVRRAADCRRVDPPPPLDRSGDPEPRPPEPDRGADRRTVMKPHISVLTPCYNEAENVDALYARIRAVFDALPEYTYEHVFIDNASTDETLERLKALAERDRNVKVIVNTRNFGHIRSPYHALLQCRGDAVIGDGGRPPGSAGADPAVSREVARGLQGRARRQGGQRGVVADVRDPARRLRASSTGSRR